MTLALLLTAVTGAWAQEETLLTTINASSDFISGSKTFDGVATVTFTGNIAYDDMPNYGWSAGYGTPGGSVSVEPAEGITISSCKFYFNTNETYTISTAPFVLYPTTEDSSYRIYTGPNSTGEMLYGYGIKKIEVYGTAEAPINVEPGSSANTWTFSMPGSDVVLTPIYAKAAAFATTGTEPDVKTLLPEAAEGVIAGTDAPLIKEGTGIVAFAGESTEVTQGTLMYAIGTSATEAPALTAFSATVPTAKTVADDGADVLVWYYIQGADAPEGEAATLDNTFSDTEPACLTVQVLTNKFDIQFSAANANTIEAGKATVTVAGAAATVTDGKLQGVKMGSEVKLEAKPGYKFRKVEVKKAAGKLASEVTPEDIFKVIASDGIIYDNIAAAESAGTVAQGLIVYVGSSTENENYNHGLALALKDENSNTWGAAKDACNAKNTSTPIVGALWMLPSQGQWNTMFTAAGGDWKLRDCFSSAGGNNMLKDGYYWSSTGDSQWAYYYMFSGYDWEGAWGSIQPYYNEAHNVRACIAF